MSALVLAFCAAPASAHMAPRIVNGSDANITNFPFQVALVDSSLDPVDGQYCGGVIIDATHVITAAHCVYDLFGDEQAVDPSAIDVFAGSSTLSGPGTTKAVAQISFDPEYNPDINDFDIAIVTLADPLWTSDPAPAIDGINKIAPIPMVTDDTAFQTQLDATPTPTPAIVTGWGYTELDPPNDFKDQLQRANVPLVGSNTCATDYLDNATITPRLFCAGDDHSVPDNEIQDSCQGDSGGPLVIGSDLNDPSTYTLAGLVDSGNGCAERGFPGIYNRISNAAFQTFIAERDTLPPAPAENTAPQLSGGNAPGDELTCTSAPWTGQTEPLLYQFVNSAGQALTPLSADGTTYTIQQTDYSTTIQCRVKASNQGGFGFGRSAGRFVPRPVIPPPPPPPPPPAKDSVAPKLRVSSKKCTKTSCTIKVKVTDAKPSSGLGRLRATLNYTRKVKCKSRKRKHCHKTVHRSLRAGTPKNGVFTIAVRHLNPGRSYRIALVPFDKAGNRPQFSTITSVRTKPRHTRFPFF
jgi:secreted trypsin-like serine protease